MRRLLTLLTLTGVFGVVGCCHDTCDCCRTNHCPSCTQAQTGYVAPVPATTSQPMPSTGATK